MSSRPFVSLARRLYRSMPFPRVRELMFGTYTRLVRGKRTIITIEGITYDLDLGELCDLCIYLQQYEPEVVAAMNRYTRAGMTVIDIGANIGAHTVRFATLAGRDGKVIAFEPTDFAFAKLTRNLSLNDMPQVIAVKLALSDTTTPPQHVDLRSSWRTDSSRKDGMSTVGFDSLDAWAERNQLGRVDVMKVDVEGAEYPLVIGALQTIRNNMPVMMMEVVGIHLDDPARNPFLVLQGLGYRFRDLKSGADLSIEEMRD
ncbi:MAG: hypothetical protein QOE82_105, partial [Thermoanaerobaculia bacterium]|nr:hypothetical protein [Thermoanaerobaculia bacterium]